MPTNTTFAEPGTSDKMLLLQVRNGDQRAFSMLFDRHWKRLYHAALHFIEDTTTAQDIVQECFISLWEKGTHKDIENVEAYLYQSVKYKCFMQLRSGAISQRHLAHFRTMLEVHTTDETLQTEELQGTLDKAIASLPEKCREIFYLSRFESLPNKTIAEKLNISPKTVENQITKALRVLRLSVDKVISIGTILLFGL